MKFGLIALLVIGCLVTVARSAEDEYDYEEEPAAAPVTPAPARPSSARLGGLLSSRGRVNVGRKTATTQSTTAKAPVEQPVEAEEEDEEGYDENQEQQEEVLTTTTENSKKVHGGVRPFRSNQDLLAALKRRRAQVPSHRESAGSQAAAEPTTPKSKTTTSNRSKSSSSSSTGAESKTGSRGRFGGTRGSKPQQEEVEETQREEVQVKPKAYRSRG